MSNLGLGKWRTISEQKKTDILLPVLNITNASPYYINKNNI
jgi:hypothetical protein